MGAVIDQKHSVKKEKSILLEWISKSNRKAHQSNADKW